MTETTTVHSSDTPLIQGVIARAAQDLQVIIGRDIRPAAARVQRCSTLPVVKVRTHISFALALRRKDEPKRCGALLVPLPDAIGMACFMLMIPANIVASRRDEQALDPMLKDAMLEISNMLGASCTAALAELGLSEWTARSEGCHGVRLDCRPTLASVEGGQFIVGTVATQIEPFQAFDLTLIMPALD